MDPNPDPGQPSPVDSGWTSTLVPEKKPESKHKRKRKAGSASRSTGIPRYNVILWDSDEHTYDYVERMLRELFGHTAEQCHEMAETVDTQGKVIVLTTTREHAELKRDQIHAYGKDELMTNCKGSMHSTIEAVE